MWVTLRVRPTITAKVVSPDSRWLRRYNPPLPPLLRTFADERVACRPAAA